MEKKDFSMLDFFKTKANINNILLLEGLIVGLLAGLIACIYRFLLSYGEKIAYMMVNYVQEHSWFIFGLFFSKIYVLRC